MLLVMDVGNTNTVLGVYDGTTLVAHWRLTTVRDRTVDEYGILARNLLSLARIDAKAIDGVIIASVVPPLDGVLEAMARTYFGLTPLFVEPGVKTGMPILYDNPQEVGADRIVNGVAAYERCRQAVIVVDFGTATTFDAISAKGEYLGGAIAPGLAISAEALFQRAARLPRVDVRKPPKVIGRNTTHSLQSGLFFGYLALVTGILSRMRAEMGEPVRTIGTGGLSAALKSELSGLLDEVDPNLTLEGLRLLHDRNR
ncbi:MAG TPA: type III pantothenate kinase [Candidatus Polarisedimenticolia bacterium]|nr:type III pantothenate kinase [Candidatus Polarisedimenticolia bacterium]